MTKISAATIKDAARSATELMESSAPEVKLLIENPNFAIGLCLVLHKEVTELRNQLEELKNNSAQNPPTETQNPGKSPQPTFQVQNQAPEPDQQREAAPQQATAPQAPPVPQAIPRPPVAQPISSQPAEPQQQTAPPIFQQIPPGLSPQMFQIDPVGQASDVPQQNQPSRPASNANTEAKQEVFVVAPCR